MKNLPYILGGLSVVLVLSAMILLFGSKAATPPPPPVIITSFAECAQAGKPIMESYPRKCSADGIVFTEIIKELTPSEETPAITTNITETMAGLINVTMPSVDTKVTSPLVVTGNARGTWYFEASFPIEIVDASGMQVAHGIATAQSDWMTENFVPFSATLTWTTAPTGAGKLILHKDNPSGMQEHDAMLEIPILF